MDLRSVLDDPDPSVRLRAALAHQDDPRSQQLILAALEGPPLPRVSWVMLVGAAVRIAPTFEAIAPAACRVVRGANATGSTSEWSDVVRFAFTEPSSTRRPMTESQHALLEALLANDRPWNPGSLDDRRVFAQAGLPHDRDACRRLLQAHPTT